MHASATIVRTRIRPAESHMPPMLVSRAIRYGKNVPYGEDVLTVLGLRRNVGMANEIAAYV